MSKLFAAFVLSAACTGAFAASKPCDELKAEIAAKLDEKGVKNYEIAIVDSDKVAEMGEKAKVIGSCDGGTKKLTYVRK